MRTFVVNRIALFLACIRTKGLCLPSRRSVRMRGRIGADVAYEALRRYLRRPGSSTGDLLRFTRQLRAGGPVAEALEVPMS